jgi:hypothetical protein
VEIGKETCDTLISAIPGTSAACEVSFVVTLSTLFYIKLALTIAYVLSDTLYGLVVERQDARFERERQEVTLFNVNIIHDNMISNFNLGQQLKLLLGGVLDAMPTNDSEDDETRRRLTVDCKCTNDTQVSCDDPKFLCDNFSVNWNYVAFLKSGEKSIVGQICFSICQSLLLSTHHEFSLSC